MQAFEYAEAAEADNVKLTQRTYTHLLLSCLQQVPQVLAE